MKIVDNLYVTNRMSIRAISQNKVKVQVLAKMLKCLALRQNLNHRKNYQFINYFLSHLLMCYIQRTGINLYI
ncbi:hypothetical protein HBA_0924 [Sodalis endosymbiont of Henestaris halophilus]|nr:hypothetical protein HBA_0924 [Sodalis endosymbiont of Henestaris halophilus]